MISLIKISTTLFVLWISTPASSRPQGEDEVGTESERAKTSQSPPHTHHESQYSSMIRDPLRWIWIDETSLELTWSNKFSLSLNDAVKGYGISITHPQHFDPFATTTIYSSTNLQHQFGGLKSNVTYGGKLEALVGPHFWPYNLLNFTFSSAVLVPGVGLGQRGAAERPTSNTADLGSVSVGVTLRWSHSPFTTGALTSSEWDAGGGRPEGLKPDGYLLQIWDSKHLMLKLTTSVSGKHDGCIANVGGLELDTAYKATLQGLHADGRVGSTLSFSLDAGGFYVAGGGLTTDGVSECYSGLQVKCPTSERCVSPYWICDGAPDCPNGEDEIGCDKSPCDGFRCWDNVCIPSAWRCDGHHDCKDGDDEYACSACNVGEIACSTVGFCFYPNATCDGVPDCPDGWDESLAVCGRKECSPGELPCWDNDHCVEHSRLCDGTPDCPTSEDEDRSFCIAFKSIQETTTIAVDLQASLCDEKPYIKGTNCSSNDYQCESGECIPKMYFCNGHSDCQTGDDEEPNACSFYNSSPPGTDSYPESVTESTRNEITACEENMLRCPSGKCVLKNEKCSLDELCDDSINEEDCELNSNKDGGKNVINLSSENGWNKTQDTPDAQVTVAYERRASGNVTDFSDTEHNLTSPPVLKDLDLGSLEEETFTPYQSPSQESLLTQETISSGEADLSFRIFSEDSSEINEEEVDLIFTSDNQSRVGISNISDSQESLGEEQSPSTTAEVHTLDSDIFTKFNASITENEIDEDVKNATRIPKLDSDEDDDTNVHLGILLNSSENSDEDDVNFEREHIEEIEPLDQIEFNFTTDDMINGNKSLTGNTTTIEPGIITMDDGSISQTEESHVSVIDASTLAPVSEDSSSHYTTDGNLSLDSTTADIINDDIIQSSTSNVDDITQQSSNQGIYDTITTSLIPDIHKSVDQGTYDTTTTPHVPDTELSHSEPPELQYHSSTELTINDLEDSNTNSGVTVTLTTEPENWKDPAAAQKNLTILIAVHSMAEESKIPQYIIHGLDGSTYEYEVVSVNEDDSSNKTDSNPEENDRNEIIHEYTGGVHELSYLHDKISSGTRLSCSIPALILFILGVIQNI